MQKVGFVKYKSGLVHGHKMKIANIIKSRTLGWVDLAARRIHRFDPKNVIGRDQLELTGVGWRGSIMWNCFSWLLGEMN